MTRTPLLPLLSSRQCRRLHLSSRLRPPDRRAPTIGMCQRHALRQRRHPMCSPRGQPDQEVRRRCGIPSTTLQQRAWSTALSAKTAYPHRIGPCTTPAADQAHTFSSHLGSHQQGHDTLMPGLRSIHRTVLIMFSPHCSHHVCTQWAKARLTQIIDFSKEFARICLPSLTRQIGPAPSGQLRL